MPRLDRLIARNLGASRKQVTLLIKQGRVTLPDDDEIVKGVRLTQGGRIVNERLLAG